ncbi:MAG TPA: SDR family oxidoreductase [Acidimicrobiales bacterium]|nr:SDR family oxidoreductase [Acidimicrobiales bacterium]
MKGLQGKAVLVAGGAGGIGTATSIRLGAEGAMVAVADLNAPAAEAVAARINEDGGRAVSMAVDIGDEEAVASAVRAAVEAFGGLDAVHVNAADLSAETVLRDSNAVEIDLDVFDRTIRTGLRGHLLCARHAIPELAKREGGGALVFTSSAASFVGEPERPAYAMAKSGINALVRHIASRWGRSGIRANAIAPGLVLTETVAETLDPSFRAGALRNTRSPRLGRPEDIAAMVAFLVSDDGEWINGQVISVDGGATLR